MAPLRAAAVEAPAAPLTTPAAAQLYLLHCHLPAAASQATALAKLHGDLRTMVGGGRGLWPSATRRPLHRAAFLPCRHANVLKGNDKRAHMFVYRAVCSGAPS